MLDEDKEWDIRLWRRSRDETGKSILEEITSAEMLGRNVLIFFTGAIAKHEDKAQIAGHAKEAERLLSNVLLTDPVDIACTSYGTFPDDDIVDRTNSDPGFVDSKMRMFAQDYIYPLIESGTVVTILSHSIGAIFAENCRRSLVKDYKTEGYDEDAIRRKLGGVVSIVLGNISHAANLQSQHIDFPDFTCVAFNSLFDKRLRNRNPDFASGVLAAGHEEGALSIYPLAENRLLVVTHSGSNAYVWKSTGKGLELENVGANSGTGHTLKFFTTRNPVTPSGAVLALENCLGNAVARPEGEIPNVHQLIERTPTAKEKANYGESGRASLEQIKLATAGKWVGKLGQEKDGGIERK